MLAGRLQRRTTTLATRMEDTFRVRLHLPPAPGSGAALCQELRASSRRSHRPTGQTQQSGRTQNWIKPGGKVRGFPSPSESMLVEGKTACYLPDPSASRAISAMRSTIKVPRGWSHICKRSDTLLAAISKSANGRGIDRRDAASSINQRRIVALSTPNPSANHDCHADRPLYWTPRYNVAPMRARSDAETMAPTSI